MKRVVVTEEMDDAALGAKEHGRALDGLARINFFSRSARNLWTVIEALAQEDPGRRLRVLDIATGSGDIPVSLWKKAKKNGVLLEIEACDKSPQALDFARARAQKSGAQVRFFTLDIHKEVIPSGYDVLISSLFLHHLQDQDAVVFLRRMAKQAKSLVLVNDLARNVPGLILAFFGTRLLTTSRIVHADSVLSVRAAFSISEIKNALQEAGLPLARVERRWPSRFLVILKKKEMFDEAVRRH